MPNSRSVTLFDRLGNRLRARMLANGHIALSEHAHRYTYARVSRQGDVELYDDNGNFSVASLGAGDDEDEDRTGARMLMAA